MKKVRWLNIHETSPSCWSIIDLTAIVSITKFAANGFRLRLSDGTSALLTRKERNRIVGYMSRIAVIH